MSQAHPVPSPGGLNPDAAPFFPTGFKPGVRVASFSSRTGRSAEPPPEAPRVCAKASEVWAMYGYGHVQRPSRVRRIKRSFYRACRRAIASTSTSYHGRTLWEVPARLRSKIIQAQNPTPGASAKRLQTERPVLKILSWNASRGLVYQEWICWCNSRPEDVIMAQETGWSMTDNGRQNQWLCIHSHAASASQLVMVRRTLVRQSQLAYHDIIPGRLLHIRLLLAQIYDLYAVYQTAWNTTKTNRGLLQARQDLWERLKRGVQNIPNGTCLFLLGTSTEIHLT